MSFCPAMFSCVAGAHDGPACLLSIVIRKIGARQRKKKYQLHFQVLFASKFCSTSAKISWVLNGISRNLLGATVARGAQTFPADL